MSSHQTLRELRCEQAERERDEARAEVGRLKALLREAEAVANECVVCHALLQPRRDEPHCEDCIPDDQQCADYAYRREAYECALAAEVGGDPSEWPEDLRVLEMPEGRS